MYTYYYSGNVFIGPTLGEAIILAVWICQLVQKNTGARYLLLMLLLLVAIYIALSFINIQVCFLYAVCEQARCLKQIIVQNPEYPFYVSEKGYSAPLLYGATFSCTVHDLKLWIDDLFDKLIRFRCQHSALCILFQYFYARLMNEKSIVKYLELIVEGAQRITLK